MKTRSLYDILQLKFQDKFLDVVICVSPKEEFNRAVEILKTNHETFEARYAELSIITKDKQGIQTTLTFCNIREIEKLRGVTMRTLYIEDIPGHEAYIGHITHNASRVIYKD